MTVELKRFSFTSNPLTERRNLRYRLDHFWELRTFFARFGVAVDEVAYEGFAHTGRMLVRDEAGKPLLIHRFRVRPRKGAIHFSKIPVELIHGRVYGDSNGTAVVTYDGFEGKFREQDNEKGTTDGK